MRAIPPRLAVAGLGMLLAGCGVVPGGSEEYQHPPAPVVESHDCLAAGLDYSGMVPSRPPQGSSGEGSTAPPETPPAAPDRGSVPADFDAQSVVRCSMNFEGVVDAEGRWSAVQEDHLTGDLEPLLAALDQPSERGGTMACTADMEILPVLWLLDSSDRALRPAWPTNSCGKSKSGVAEALDELDSIQTVTHRIDLLEPRAALDAGCVNQWSAPMPQQQALSFIPPAPGGPGSGSAGAADGESGSVGSEATEQGGSAPGSPGLLPEPEAVDSMRACHYQVESAAQRQVSKTIETLIPATGTFVSVQILPQEQAHAVLAAAHSGAEAPGCSAAASSFAVLWPQRSGQDAGAPISVELDGCQRLIPADGKARALPDGVLAAL